jgi:molybdenum cofactor synthesis domain-containing protein
MRCAILTVSTSVAGGVAQDESGPALAEQAQGLGDDLDAIQAWLRARIADGVELLLTTGGTGFTPDDVTPEATRAVVDREAPGLAEAMRAESLRHTPMGMLSRAVTGIAGRTLIVNFPGNPNAVRQLFPVIAPVLGHAVRTLHREPGRRHGH